MFHSIQNKAKHVVDTYRWWTWTQKA